MTKAIYIVVIILVSCTALSAQSDDSRRNGGIALAGDTIIVENQQKYYDPKIASRRSAIIPGWGQIYNDNWWKVPFVYTALGVSVYFIDFNAGRYRNWKGIAEDLIEIQNTIGLTATEENQLRIARRQADSWRENRDLLYLVTLGFYALNIVEASIDAHLKGFNVDDNLALNIKPKLGVISNGVPYIGASLTFSLSK